jgi:hypothetical protein
MSMMSVKDVVTGSRADVTYSDLDCEPRQQQTSCGDGVMCAFRYIGRAPGRFQISGWGTFNDVNW